MTRSAGSDSDVVFGRCNQKSEPVSSHARSLAALPEGVHPCSTYFGPEHAQPFQVPRHIIVVQATMTDPPEPSADAVSSMPSSHQACPDCFQRRGHPSRHGQAPHDEAPSALSRTTDVGETEEVEGLWASAAFNGIAPELQNPRLRTCCGFRARLAQLTASVPRALTCDARSLLHDQFGRLNIAGPGRILASSGFGARHE